MLEEFVDGDCERARTGAVGIGDEDRRGAGDEDLGDDFVENEWEVADASANGSSFSWPPILVALLFEKESTFIPPNLCKRRRTSTRSSSSLSRAALMSILMVFGVTFCAVAFVGRELRYIKDTESAPPSSPRWRTAGEEPFDGVVLLPTIEPPLKYSVLSGKS